MNSHLVTVEVCVVSGADERMNANGLALDKNRLKRLNRKAVQGRSAVQHDRMAFGHLFEDIPDLWSLALDEFLGATNCMDIAKLLKATNDKWLEKNECHFFGQPALVELEFRPDDDDRAARVIDALSEKVLTEAPTFTLKHVAERLERAVGGTRYSATVASVIKEGIHRLLKHALFVANDDFWSLELQQGAKTVVTVDDTAIKIIKIGCRKTSTFKRNERAEIRRKDWKHIQDHPLGSCF